jgi:CheY-like chemotaxis protein
MKRVLIVDDDAEVREGLEALLADHYDVTVACNGRSGLEKVDQGSFDAVVLDLSMPVLDGVGFMEGLSHRPQRPKVIIASGNSDVGEVAHSLGAQDFLPKPFDPDCLEQKLLRVLH